MNFYKHHIGDFAAATAHLSWDEDMAYSRLIRAYYQHERAIPAEKRAIYRLTRAASKAQRDAVDAVLDEFFTLQDDGYHQKRCDEELVKANAQADANRKVAADREERRRKWRDEQSTNRGSSVHESSNESLSEPEHDSFPSREPNQTPDSRHQTPDTRQEQKREPRAPSPQGAASLAMRRGGLTTSNPSDPRLIAAIEAGATPAMFEHTAREAVEQGKGAPWVIATIRGRLADAAKPPAPGASHARPQGSSAIERAEAEAARRRAQRDEHQ